VEVAGIELVPTAWTLRNPLLASTTRRLPSRPVGSRWVRLLTPSTGPGASAGPDPSGRLGQVGQSDPSSVQGVATAPCDPVGDHVEQRGRMRTSQLRNCQISNRIGKTVRDLLSEFQRASFPSRPAQRVVTGARCAERLAPRSGPLGYQTRCQRGSGVHASSASAPRPGSCARSSATNRGWTSGHSRFCLDAPSTDRRHVSIE
jgi:hypothetical protein